MDKKKILIVVLGVVILVSIIAAILIITNNEEDTKYGIEGIALPKNKEILKEKTVENLKITDISLLTREGISTYKAKVENNTNKDIEIDFLYVIFYEEKQENKIIALQDSTIEAESQTYINISSETDLSKTSNVKYELITKVE